MISLSRSTFRRGVTEVTLLVSLRFVLRRTVKRIKDRVIKRMRRAEGKE